MAFGRLGTFGTGFGRRGHAPRTPWWLAGSSLDMDFVKNRARQAGLFYMPSALLSTTRASVGYADNTAGVWSSFASNIPRITNKGLLVEESRTNSIRNNSMQGAVAGTPGTNPANVSNSALGTLTKSVVSADSQNGIDYWDIRLVGTTSNTSFNINLDGAAIIAASNGQTWTNSAFLAAVAGGFANITGIAVRMAIYDAGVVYLGEVGSPTVLNSLPSSLDTTSRKTTTGTIANASTALIGPYLQFTWASGVAIDITLRIGWPQLELGAFATSPIRTTAAAATRAADVIDVAGVVPGAFGTLFSEAMMPATQPGRFPAIFAAHGVAGDNDRVALYMNGTNLTRSMVTTVGGINQCDVSAGVSVVGTPFKQAGRYNTNDFSHAGNGTLGTPDVSGSIPTLTKLAIGRLGASSNFLNGYARRVAHFPGLLMSDAQLQALTQ